MGARWHARGSLVLSADWSPRIPQLSLLSFTIRALSGSAHTCLRSWVHSASHILPPGDIYKDHTLECHSRYPHDLGVRSVVYDFLVSYVLRIFFFEVCDYMFGGSCSAIQRQTSAELIYSGVCPFRGEKRKQCLMRFNNTSAQMMPLRRRLFCMHFDIISILFHSSLQPSLYPSVNKSHANKAESSFL